ncbi:hypothetical protein GPECTOR_26g589 [Gonium pectorale]|uniref:Uncharacterized protein n=1 Tax=Gonium pectorale TaxID=33097 RepID=A0A150GFT2_GONPE|nr:hypothetical protein GPECTOR_26g589 [Gonium pectorale]|eukprot:KXZ48686.1 hypothetical protein GPECTOR_26g589 [Gonium pectorale]
MRPSSNSCGLGTCRKEGDAKYRQLRVKARFREPVRPPALPAEEEAELKRVWAEEWHGFPAWEYVALARMAVGGRRWAAMSNDRRRSAVERFLLCGPWAATQEPSPEQLSRMRATSSSARFVQLGHPARRDTATGAFCAAHGLATTAMLKSERPHNPDYYDLHNTTSLGEKTTTAEICYKIVVPATRAFGAAYVDLFLGPELWPDSDPQSRELPSPPGLSANGNAEEGNAEEGNAEEGTATVTAKERVKGFFLSHAWGMPFMQLVTVTIYNDAPPQHDGGPYWIDIFCKNQHVPIRESDLTDNILRSSAVVLAVHPWPKPLLTTRVWCLFEVLTAAQSKVDMRLKFCQAAAGQLQGGFAKKYTQWNYSKVYDDCIKGGLSSVLTGAGELVEAIDVQQAEATVASDRDMIMRLIQQSVGAEEMNRLVREMLTTGLASAAQELVQADVGQDRMAYYSYEGGWD